MNESFNVAGTLILRDIIEFSEAGSFIRPLG
jgi:hypothetical protein